MCWTLLFRFQIKRPWTRSGSYFRGVLPDRPGPDSCQPWSGQTCLEEVRWAERRPGPGRWPGCIWRRPPRSAHCWSAWYCRSPHPPLCQSQISRWDKNTSVTTTRGANTQHGNQQQPVSEYVKSGAHDPPNSELPPRRCFTRPCRLFVGLSVLSVLYSVTKKLLCKVYLLFRLFIYCRSLSLFINPIGLIEFLEVV